MKYAIVLMCLVGCGPTGEPIQVDCLTFYSEAPVNRADLGFNVALAKEILNPFVDKKDFCRMFERTPISILPDDAWNCRPVNPECKEACTLACTAGDGLAGGVHLTKHGEALVHELFHVRDDVVGRPPNYTHDGWDRLGYEAADQDFQFRFHDLSP